MNRSLLLTAATALIAGSAGAVQALPQGPTIAGSTGGVGATFDNSVPNALTVNQSATRVVIDWNSFNIASGETVNFNQAAPNWIAFNIVNTNPRTGISPLSTLAGNLNAQGGVWLFSTGGVLVGSTGRIDVGSFAAITAPLGNGGDIGQLLNPDPNTGLTTVAEDPPIGAGVEQITVQKGAQINASSGYVVLQAETMTQDGDISAADGVGYAVAETGQTQFLTSPAGQQLQSAGITLLVGQDRPSFTHLGDTNALWVGIDTPGGTMQAGYHTLINLGGTIEASGVKPDGSDKGVVLLVGGTLGPNYPGYTGSSIGVDESGGDITAAHGLYITTDSIIMGKAEIGGPIDLETYGDLVTTQPLASGLNAGPNLSGDTRLASNGTVGVVTVNAPLSVGGGLTIAAPGAITLNAPVGVNGTATFVNSPTGSLNVNAALTTGGDLDVFNEPATGGGPVNFNVPVSVGGSSFINATTVKLDQMTLGGTLDVEPSSDIEIAGDIAAQGGIVLFTGTGSVTTDPGVSLTAGGQIYIQNVGNVTLGGPVMGLAFDAFAVGGTLTVAPTASVTTTGVASAPVWPIANANNIAGPGTTADGPFNVLTLAGERIDIEGPITAGPAGNRNDIYIQDIAGLTESQALAGPVVLGGASGASNFQLTNSTLQLFTGRNLIVLGGSAASASSFVDVDVEDVSFDSTKLSGLWLGTASTANILVSGALTVTGGQPFDVQLGLARGASAGSGLNAFIPGDIEITGSLGSASAPLGSVDMIARGDILMGSTGFIAAAEANPSFDAVTQSSAFPGLPPDHVFVDAGSLQLAALGRIIQQNTGPNPVTDAGLVVGAPAQGQPLVVAPAALAGVTFVGGGGWTATFNQGPTAVDLFGVLGGSPEGVGTSAAQLPNLLDPSIHLLQSYRINACAFTTVCLDDPESIADVSVNGPIDSLQNLAALPTPALDPSLGAMLASDTAFGDNQDNDRLGSANPVTETGDRERWISHAGAAQ